MSDPELTYYGHVDANGTLHLPRKKVAKEVAVLAGKEVEVTIRRKRKRRTTPQLRYYWGCIVRDITITLREMDPETGWTPDGVHEVLKAKFLPLVRQWREFVNEETGEAIREPLTTTKLTTTEEEIYHDYCRKWAAEFLGIGIALPNEQAEMAFNF